MKRYNNLFDSICDIENIKLADKKARLHKSKNFGVIVHDNHKEEDYQRLIESLQNGTCKTSRYSTFKLYEPKERIIFRLPYYPDRILHHAVMNVLEPIWTKIFVKNTYACIKERGIHKLVKDLKTDLNDNPEDTKYCLKLDIKKFYPSIDHDVLKSIIRKKIKDIKLLKLLDEIIDSANGVPIGNYLSQYFANLYLAYFDHWLVEEVKVKHYYRYADDITILSGSKELLRKYLILIKLYLKQVLKLQIKENYQIFPVDKRGIDFVGYKFYHTYTLLRKSIKYRMYRTINNYNKKLFGFTSFLQKITSYIGWLKHCNSKHLLQIICEKTNICRSNWNGIDSIISNFYDRRIFLYNLILRNKYDRLDFIFRHKPYSVRVRNKKLRYTIYDRLPFPFLLKLKRKAIKQDLQGKQSSNIISVPAFM